MSEIKDLRVAADGWRVAVVSATPPFAGRPASVKVTIRPLIGWAHVHDPGNDHYWAPAWWDELGMTTGNPWQEIAWPLAPTEQHLDAELEEYLKAEALEMVEMQEERKKHG